MRKIWTNALSGTALKLIAAASMLLDHIAYFFDFTGRVPSWFTSAGRLAAPLYLFCLAEGFAHTRSRGRYFLRIYLLSAAMASVRFCMQYGGIGVRGDGFYPAAPAAAGACCCGRAAAVAVCGIPALCRTAGVRAADRLCLHGLAPALGHDGGHEPARAADGPAHLSAPGAQAAVRVRTVSSTF